MAAFIFSFGRFFARFHLWVPTVVCYGLVKPVSRWDSTSRNRFAYACMMGRRSKLVRQIYTALLIEAMDYSADVNMWLSKIAWTLGRARLSTLILRRTEESYPNSFPGIIAECQKRFGKAILNQSLSSQLSLAIDQLGLPNPASGPVAVAPVSKKYLGLYRLWREFFDKNAFGEVLLLALDSDTVNEVRSHANARVLDLSTHFVFDDENVIDRYVRSNLWILRVMILRDLIKRGYTLLSLDLDALVVGDLRHLIESLPQCEIIAQEDYSIPLDVARRLGFIVCCGFMFIRSSPSTMAFFDRYAERTALETDDQLALNHLLADEGGVHVIRRGRYMEFTAGGISWVCPDKLSVSRDIRVGTVIRHFQQTGQTNEELKLLAGLS